MKPKREKRMSIFMAAMNVTKIYGLCEADLETLIDILNEPKLDAFDFEAIADHARRMDALFKKAGCSDYSGTFLKEWRLVKGELKVQAN